jgi:hypothetical protein
MVFCLPRPEVAVRKLYLPVGARHFRSRQAYDLAYETKHPDDRERAWRRVRKCREPCPEKPAGMSAARVRAHMVDHVVLDLTTQYSSFFPGPG